MRAHISCQQYVYIWHTGDDIIADEEMDIELPYLNLYLHHTKKLKPFKFYEYTNLRIWAKHRSYNGMLEKEIPPEISDAVHTRAIPIRKGQYDYRAWHYSLNDPLHGTVFVLLYIRFNMKYITILKQCQIN